MRVIEITDRKFLCQYLNGDDFSTNPTTVYTKFPLYNAGDRAKVALTVLVSTITEADSTIQIKASTDGSYIKLEHPFNSWSENEGFVVGDTVRVEANGNNTSETINRIQGRYMWISDTSFFSTLGVTDGTKRSDYVIKTTTVPNELQFKFGIIPNSQVTPTFNSLITGEEQAYSISSIVSLISKQMDYMGSSQSDLGTVKVEYGSASGTGSYIFSFYITHEFEWPSYIDSYQNAYKNTSIPDEFKGFESYRYVTAYNFSTNKRNGNPGVFVVDDFMKGSIGFVNQNFNGGKTVYSLNSVALDIGGTAVDNIDVDETTSFTVQIQKSGGNFTAGVKAYVYHAKLPTKDEYNEANTYAENFVLDSHYETDGGGTTDSTIINNLNVAINAIDTTKLDITFDLIYGDTEKAFIEDGDYYFIGVSVADSSLSVEESDRMTVWIAVDTFTKSAEVLDQVTDVKFYIFNMAQDPAVATPYTGVQSNVGGLYLVKDSTLTIAKAPDSADALIQNFIGGIVALNETTGDWFWLSKTDFSLGDALAPEVLEEVDGTTYQNICFEGYNNLGIPLDDEYNAISLSASAPGSYSATQTFTFTFAVQFPWRTWERNPDANPVFYSCDRTAFGGLNYNAANYSKVNGYSVYIAVYCDILSGGVTTPYLMYSDECTIKDFDDDSYLSGWTGSVVYSTAETGITMENGIWKYLDEDVHITCTLDNPGALVTLTDYIAEVLTEDSDTTGKAWRLHSEKDWSDPNNPLKPLDGETYVKLTQVAGTPNTIVIECLYKKEFLKEGVPINIYPIFKKE